jgi:hypothetical protein
MKTSNSAGIAPKDVEDAMTALAQASPIVTQESRISTECHTSLLVGREDIFNKEYVRVGTTEVRSLEAFRRYSRISHHGAVRAIEPSLKRSSSYLIFRDEHCIIKCKGIHYYHNVKFNSHSYISTPRLNRSARAQPASSLFYDITEI